MSVDLSSLKRRKWGETLRQDNWWIGPLVVFLVLSSFVVYATWAAFQNENYVYGNYLSPFYSPLLFNGGDVGVPGDGHQHSWFGDEPGWWILPFFSPALLILPFPAGFRMTCYYYRGAYYKAFWADPPACSVGEPRKNYLGEHSLPLILQNIHRYFLYFAIIFLFILAYDAYCGFFFDTDGDGKFTNFGVGVGTFCPLHECVFVERLHFGLPFVAKSGWRLDECVFQNSGKNEMLRLCQLFEIDTT